ncbi:hypothetical protein FB548_0722 [Pseudoxanthomonas sp. 3HH-4]|uniref:hypothetical protein n=1 Tax=Pseudoxanthomonas sp. 3HH-4 TaxID=1690214 RepID=UPI0011755FE8|nr:hypothetical protein [Pseudoxanthomonas sp. 3HH-4]TQM17341.1 hypothetical protein FB548_0722 [Pseudoxanthomonas sp. 3HH-4]
MRPSKTDLARQTLQAHTGTLGMRERRALILCDGQRDLGELVRLLGQDAPLLVQRLVQTGYLTAADTPTTPLPAASTTRVPTTNAPAGPRRSLVAAKVYLSGMLELQRDDGARRHRERLLARLDDDAMLEALADALRFLEARMASTLAGRIRERLLEALPPEAARRLQHLSDAQAETAAT